MNTGTQTGRNIKMDESLKYYNEAFFKKRGAWRSDYNLIAKWISKNIAGQSFGDIGCGNGHMISLLHRTGKKVWGVDAAENFEQYIDKEIQPYVKKADLTKSYKFNKCDVALCFEVAERLDKVHADTLVKSIASTEANIVLFTAAQPGEAGVRHINLQPRSYWLDKYKTQNYYLDVALTEKFRDDLANRIKNPVWYLSDIMILRRFDSPEAGEAYVESGNYIKELKKQINDLMYSNNKMKHELWLVSQQLNAVLNSARWKTSSKLIGLMKR